MTNQNKFKVNNKNNNKINNKLELIMASYIKFKSGDKTLLCLFIDLEYLI